MATLEGWVVLGDIVGDTGQEKDNKVFHSKAHPLQSRVYPWIRELEVMNHKCDHGDHLWGYQ